MDAKAFPEKTFLRTSKWYSGALGVCLLLFVHQSYVYLCAYMFYSLHLPCRVITHLVGPQYSSGLKTLFRQRMQTRSTEVHVMFLLVHGVVSVDSIFSEK